MLRKYLLLSLIGITNGMVPLLIGSTLAVWLKEIGINLTAIGLISLANLPFAFSFALSTSLEYLSRWRYFSFKMVLLLCLWLSAVAVFIIPSVIHNHATLFYTCLLLSVACSIARTILLALQKILFSDAELITAINVATISYKLGILLGGSLALYLSQFYSWASLYHYLAGLVVASSLIIGLFPSTSFSFPHHAVAQNWLQMLIAPFRKLAKIPQLPLIALLMFCYRAPDNLITYYFDLFYIHFGLSKTDVALGYKLYGMLIASLGGIWCIRLLKHNSYLSNLQLALGLHLASYLLIYIFTLYPAPLWVFYVCVTSEEFSRGMTMLTFWSYQTHLCEREHVLIQLSILTALDSLSYSILSSCGGNLIQNFGYPNFILMVIVSFIPAFIILHYLNRYKKCKSLT
jgi:PAT family beta-lactamase induction signal transducer AmpG